MSTSSEAMSASMEVVLVKLGGSLITDKRRPERARIEVIERLARELEEIGQDGVRLILGHGSGSFGHVAAARYGIHEGVRAPKQVMGVTETQDRAATLHRMVMGALCQQGVPAFSLSPSSFLVSAGGASAELWIEPLIGALQLGMLPVVYGDVVMDRELGASIVSTESVFLALAGELQRRGFVVRRSIWLGETDGIYDSRGVTIEELQLDSVEDVLDQIVGASGTDVTGGMRHRLETAARLASLGVESWIANGLEPGVLGQILKGSRGKGTKVPAAASKSPPTS
jgi:isopentenyl phosphate kinase